MKTVRLLYGKEGMVLSVPDHARVLEGKDVPALADPDRAVAEALAHPIGTPPLADLIATRRPRTVAITVSDITRPVPNREFLPVLLDVLNRVGVTDAQIVLVIGTGMHRASTAQEREILLGADILRRLEVTDHSAGDASTLVRVSDDPPVQVCRRFAEADFRIVTGYIESHFMAGYSGGRKGVCPALVDLGTIQRFHGFDTLSDPRADTGVLDGNPCHEIALRVARTVGVDFLFNVTITRDRRIAGIFCGDLVRAHEAGCREAAESTRADIDAPFDLIVTSGGGFPLDQTFYQSCKGMCTAMPGLTDRSTLLQVSHCGEQLGSPAFADIVLKWGRDWRGFLADLEAHRDVTHLDQWQFQMQARVLERIGVDRLWFVTDGLPPDVQRRIAIHPVLGEGDARVRAQRALDAYVAENPTARIGVVPDGPYTLLRRIAAGALG